jgi:hypothetical protein
MAKRLVRKLEAFAMHAHNSRADYRAIFRMLADVPRNARVVELGEGAVVGIPIVDEDRGTFFLRVVEGDDSAALVLNTSTGGTRENILGESELLSHATHLVVDPSKRRAVIEYMHRGAKAPLIGATIEAILRLRHQREMSEFRFEFAPVIRENFITEINRFERIREANLRVTRPNASWSDRYTELSDFMEESDGDKVEVGIRARRGGTLKKNSGLVGVIKEVVKDQQPYLDDAKVVGIRHDEENETTVHAKKHVTHTRISVDADDAGVPNADDVKTKLLKFLRIL